MISSDFTTALILGFVWALIEFTLLGTSVGGSLLIGLFVCLGYLAAGWLLPSKDSS